jgi:hypothetical protein
MLLSPPPSPPPQSSLLIPLDPSSLAVYSSLNTLKTDEPGWWLAKHIKNDLVGWIPSSFIDVLGPHVAAAAREAKEAKVGGGGAGAGTPAGPKEPPRAPARADVPPPAVQRSAPAAVQRSPPAAVPQPVSEQASGGGRCDSPVLELSSGDKLSYEDVKRGRDDGSLRRDALEVRDPCI